MESTTIQGVPDDFTTNCGGIGATACATPEVSGTITCAPQKAHVPRRPANSGPTVFFSAQSGHVNSIAMA
jgi:hypothetical protein